MMSQRPEKLPLWVRCAVAAMWELEIDLWHLRKDDRTEILLAALDAEPLAGSPDKVPLFVEAACHQRWRSILAERRDKQGRKKR